MEHVPVLQAEVIAGLALRPNATIVDATLGGAGHAAAMLEATAPAGRLLGLDADHDAVERAHKRLARFGDRVVLARSSFRDLGDVARTNGFATVDAIMLDLGISSFQLSAAERGFSFQIAGPLDMRMDSSAALTADEIVNTWSQEALADVIYQYGEEPRSRRIARAIVSARPIETTTELAAVVARTLGGRRDRGRTHPATRVFQAIRVAVNDELGALEAVLPQIVTLLAPGGRVAIIAFHSLEDRIVKRFFQQERRDCICPSDLPICRCQHRASLKIVTRKPVLPGHAEIIENPRSRSAKLRIAERI